MNTDRLFYLMDLYFDQEISLEERLEFEVLLSENEEAQKLFWEKAEWNLVLHAVCKIPVEELLENKVLLPPVDHHVLGLFKRPPIVSVLVSCCVMVFLIAVLSLVTIKFNQSNDDTTDYSNIVVARITKSREVKWASPQDRLPLQAKLHGGQMLHLASGILKIKFNNGASVVLQGPAEFQVDSPGAGTLNAGMLSASVPEAAIGFIVKTPIAQIVDLGTEFGVEVDSGGITDVTVFVGEIRLSVLDKAGNVKRSIHVTENSAARVTAEHTLQANLKPRSGHFSSTRNLKGNLPKRITEISYTYEGTPQKSLPESAPKSTVWPDTLNSGQELRNRVTATESYTDEQWVGFYDLKDTKKPQPLITFDLGERCNLSKVMIYYLHSNSQAGGTITAPEEVRISVSDNGVDFSEPVTFTPFDSSPGNSVRVATVLLSKMSGRFVRLDFRQESAWTFLTEIRFPGLNVEETKK